MTKIGDPFIPLQVQSTVAKTGQPEPSHARAAHVFNEPAESAKLSPLARQLAAAAERAAIRDSQLTRRELADLASRINMHLGGGGYELMKPLYDAVVPDTDDLELLARARQATDFLNGTAANPFKDLSTEQLLLIAYDEGGDFTYNERYAAASESFGRHSEWTYYIVAKARGEFERTGSDTDAVREMVEYYKALPAIRGAQFDGFELRAKLLHEGPELPRDDEVTSIYDVILQTTLELEQQADEAKPPLTPPAQGASKQQ